jgi:hypothetical protein
MTVSSNHRLPGYSPDAKQRAGICN